MCIPLSLLCVFLYLYFVYCSISICTSCFNLHSKVQPFTLIVFLLYCLFTLYLRPYPAMCYLCLQQRHLIIKKSFYLKELILILKNRNLCVIDPNEFLLASPIAAMLKSLNVHYNRKCVLVFHLCLLIMLILISMCAPCI